MVLFLDQNGGWLCRPVLGVTRRPRGFYALGRLEPLIPLDQVPLVERECRGEAVKINRPTPPDHALEGIADRLYLPRVLVERGADLFRVLGARLSWR
jgi:hypothetical protein